MAYNDLKKYRKQVYTGMSVGASHAWKYPDGKWEETKVAPDKWSFRFSSIKRREVAAPIGSGVPVASEYHWHIIADQIVRKINANEYSTVMTGMKSKIGHKRPYWKEFSYKYPGQQSEKERIIKSLKEAIRQLEE